MRICIIGGCGHYAYVLRGLKGGNRHELAAIAPGPGETDVDHVAAQAEKAGFNPKIYEDYRVMLDEVQPEAVAVNGIFTSTAELTVEMLERGIHTFVEKPLAHTRAQLDQVKQAYKASGVRLVPMMDYRYRRSFYTAFQAVQNGVIGEVRLMNAQKSYKLGKRRPFFHQRKTYGGTIPWVGSHAVDWVSWYGGQPFLSVFASHTPLHNRGHGELEMSALCHYTLDNEVFASVSIDYLRPEKAATHGDDRIRIVGTEGIIEVIGDQAWLLTHEEKHPVEMEYQQTPMIFQDFLQAVEEGTYGLVSAEDAFTVTQACILANESADEAILKHFTSY